MCVSCVCVLCVLCVLRGVCVCVVSCVVCVLCCVCVVCAVCVRCVCCCVCAVCVVWGVHMYVVCVHRQASRAGRAGRPGTEGSKQTSRQANKQGGSVFLAARIPQLRSQCRNCGHTMQRQPQPNYRSPRPLPSISAPLGLSPSTPLIFPELCRAALSRGANPQNELVNVRDPVSQINWLLLDLAEVRHRR